MKKVVGWSLAASSLLFLVGCGKGDLGTYQEALVALSDTNHQTTTVKDIKIKSKDKELLVMANQLNDVTVNVDTKTADENVDSTINVNILGEDLVYRSLVVDGTTYASVQNAEGYGKVMHTLADFDLETTELAALNGKFLLADDTELVNKESLEYAKMGEMQTFLHEQAKAMADDMDAKSLVVEDKKLTYTWYKEEVAHYLENYVIDLAQTDTVDVSDEEVDELLSSLDEMFENIDTLDISLTYNKAEKNWTSKIFLAALAYDIDEFSVNIDMQGEQVKEMNIEAPAKADILTEEQFNEIIGAAMMAGAMKEDFEEFKAEYKKMSKEEQAELKKELGNSLTKRQLAELDE